MQRWIAGLVPFTQLLAAGQARTLGPSRLGRAFPGWFNTSLFSAALQRGEQRRTASAVS
jgi:hypothetical protein